MERVFTDFEADADDTHLETLNLIMKKYDLWDMNLTGRNFQEKSHNATIDKQGRMKIFDYAEFNC